MKPTNKTTHHQRIIDEFTERAEAFATAAPIADPEALDLLVRMSGAGPHDTVLDVACGAGVVVCAFAPFVRHATGIDITPAMIRRAEFLQQEKGLHNVSWQVGDSRELPYPDASYSIVLTRYSVHHIEEPVITFGEMVRVCAPGGRVLLVDVCASSAASRAAAFNAFERLRDPSHVRALSKEELNGLFMTAGLRNLSSSSYSLQFTLRDLLEHSLAAPADVQRIREIIAEQLHMIEPCFPVEEANGEVIISYPINVLCASKPLALA